MARAQAGGHGAARPRPSPSALPRRLPARSGGGDRPRRDQASRASRSPAGSMQPHPVLGKIVFHEDAALPLDPGGLARERGLMRLLLDTCALLWMVGAPDKLSATAQRAMTGSDVRLCLSATSPRSRVAVKHGKGKLSLPMPPREWVRRAPRRLRDRGAACHLRGSPRWRRRSSCRTPIPATGMIHRDGDAAPDPGGHLGPPDRRLRRHRRPLVRRRSRGSLPLAPCAGTTRRSASADVSSSAARDVLGHHPTPLLPAETVLPVPCPSSVS